jgi:multiple sugar transport system permease protein
VGGESKIVKKSGLMMLLFAAPALMLVAGFVGYPLLYTVYLSFTNKHSVETVISFVGFANYSKLLGDEVFWRDFGNTLIYTGGTVSLQLLCGIVVALILNENFKGRSIARGLALFPYVVPFIVATLVWKWMLNPMYGIVQYWLMNWGIVSPTFDWGASGYWSMLFTILVGVWWLHPFVTMCVLSRLQVINPELYNAAHIDGASAWGRFRHITMSQLRPVLFIVILLRLIWMFVNFDGVYLMTRGGPIGQTETLPLLIYMKAFSAYRWGEASAVAVVMFLVLVVATIAYFKVYRR